MSDYVNPNGVTPEGVTALASAGNAVNTFMGNFAQSLGDMTMNKKNRQFAREEAEKAYQRSLEMWNMTNAYNTPAQQMQRYAEAGLNPNLIYGQGTPGNSSSSVPAYQPAKNELQIHNPTAPEISVVQDALIKRQMYEKLVSETDNRDTDTRYKEVMTVYNSLKAFGQQMFNLKQYGTGPQNYYSDYDFDKGVNVPYTIQPGSIAAQDLAAAELEVKRLKADIDLKIQQSGNQDMIRQWNEYKLHMMKQYGTNIDRDNTWERKAVMLLDKAIYKMAGQSLDSALKIPGYGK